MNEPRTVTARWVFPVAGPPLEGGTITVRGEVIEAVEPRGVRSPDEDLGNVALIPGLVNAHTHLDLSGARGQIPPTDPDHFPDWLRGVIAYRRSRTAEETQADIRAGLAECLRYGTTLLGDIAADGQSWDALAGAPLRALVFREMIGLSVDRASQAMMETREWLAGHPGTRGCRPAISPHAPYSAQHPLFLCGQHWDRVVATHLAESPAEAEFLATRQGPFATFLESLGIRPPYPLVAPSAEAVVEALRTAPGSLLVHGNYLAPGISVGRNQSVVYCPRTHAAFGHPPHPFRDFLARGVRVCLGTDSLASNPDLDILAEARFIRERYPDFPGGALLRMITLSGAEALGWADEVGSLEPGQSADLVAVPLPNADVPDPHDLLFATTGDRRTMFRGSWR